MIATCAEETHYLHVTRSRGGLCERRTFSGLGDLGRFPIDQISNASSRSIDRTVHVPPVRACDGRPRRLEHHCDDASGAVAEALVCDVQDHSDASYAAGMSRQCREQSIFGVRPMCWGRFVFVNNVNAHDSNRANERPIATCTITARPSGLRLIDNAPFGPT
jgi:hypothetical protein